MLVVHLVCCNLVGTRQVTNRKLQSIVYSTVSYGSGALEEEGLSIALALDKAPRSNGKDY